MSQTRVSFIQYLKVQEKKFHSLAQDVSKKPSVKHIHRLRLSARRLRAALWVLSQSSAEFGCRSLIRKLRKLGRNLGKVRTLDVAIRDAKHYEMNPGDLQQQRRELRKSIRRFLTHKERKDFQQQMKNVIKRATGTKFEINTTFKIARKKRRRRLQPWIENKIRNQDELHQLRIIIKKTRYALEAMGKPTQPLAKVQNALGRIHDLDVLEGLLGGNKVLTHDRKLLSQAAVRLTAPALQYAHSQLC